MSDQVRIGVQVIGVLFVLVGAAVMGAAVRNLEKAPARNPDAAADGRLTAAAAALCGGGSALLAATSI